MESLIKLVLSNNLLFGLIPEFPEHVSVDTNTDLIYPTKPTLSVGLLVAVTSAVSTFVTFIGPAVFLSLYENAAQIQSEEHFSQPQVTSGNSLTPNGVHRSNIHEIGWTQRVKIVEAMAHALSYLHHDCTPPIVHRDISSNNILLNSQQEAFVADFGTARLLHTESSNQSVIAGTYGYIAPVSRTQKIIEEPYRRRKFLVWPLRVAQRAAAQRLICSNQSFESRIKILSTVRSPKLKAKEERACTSESNSVNGAKNISPRCTHGLREAEHPLYFFSRIVGRGKREKKAAEEKVEPQ
ncbi:hypothetical protein C3L33_18844, partial [Rhododendron williamsianum]